MLIQMLVFAEADQSRETHQINDSPNCGSVVIKLNESKAVLLGGCKFISVVQDQGGKNSPSMMDSGL